MELKYEPPTPNLDILALALFERTGRGIIIDSLIKTKMADEPEVECPICLVYKRRDEFVLTTCEHKVCTPCVVQLLKVTRRCPLCRQEISAFDTSWLVGGEPLMKPFTTIYDGVYVQGQTVGLASYHFSEEESYISYESAPLIWRLDDGTPPPEKKPFENASFNLETRTFTGDINWTPVSFNGDAKWVYRIVFSEDFMEIESGEVKAFDSSENTRSPHKYGVHLFYARILDLERSVL